MSETPGLLSDSPPAAADSMPWSQRLSRFWSLWRRWLPFLGTAVIIGLLLRQIHPREVGRLLLHVQWRWLGVGLGWYLVTNVLRAYRFGALLALPGPATPLRFLPDMIALSFFNNVLPARGGELSFPYLVARRHRLAVGQSMALLLIARFFDYLAVASLYVVFTYLEHSHLLLAGKGVVIGLGALFLLSLLCLLGLPWLGRSGLRSSDRLLRWLDVPARWRDKVVEDVGRRAVSAAEQVHSPRVYLLTYAWSLLTWLATFAWFAAFLQAIGIPTHYPLVVVGATFATLANAIPFIAVGGFGAQEAGWAFGFHLTGMTTEVAIASGLAVNVLTILASVLFGMVAFAAMRWQR